MENNKIKEKNFKMAEKKKINIYLNETLLNKVDEQANEFGINRSAMIGVIIKQYMDQQEVLKIGKIADLQEELNNLINLSKGE